MTSDHCVLVTELLHHHPSKDLEETRAQVFASYDVMPIAAPPRTDQA